MELDVIDNLDKIHAVEWNRLAGHSPPLQHAFLTALHDSGAASAKTGWIPRYLTVRKGDALVGAMPAYEKYHSHGEYVFDWAWAEAYERYGLAYYPKILVAIPFTPVPGPRLLASCPEVRARLVEGLGELRSAVGASSIHCLFPHEDDWPAFTQAGMMSREGVQFHWQNQDYVNFESFLATLNHEKRKKIRQERRKIAETGITFEWRQGNEIRPQDWLFFEACYRNTYALHRSTPYLNQEFFQQLGQNQSHQVCLILALREGRPIASALNLFDSQRAYGRYWGALEYVPGLHFETCYYQSLEFCIHRGIAVFEGGAQGEHKLARGLMPTRTLSFHQLADEHFSTAVQQFLARESQGIAHYRDELEAHGPYKKESM
ncbi:MAG: N-acetyltransferase [Ferrovum sp.]|nr:N-acetyltransferase [Ferrovum sp.]NDU86870.1 N-acetyltransferase [Ferrovum sp.]